MPPIFPTQFPQLVFKFGGIGSTVLTGWFAIIASMSVHLLFHQAAFTVQDSNPVSFLLLIGSNPIFRDLTNFPGGLVRLEVADFEKGAGQVALTLRLLGAPEAIHLAPMYELGMEYLR